MRRLKTWTSICFGLGLVLLFSMPWILSARPEDQASRETRARFALGLTLYSAALLVLFFVIVVLSWRIIVRQREEAREQSLENMRELIEGTLSDHERKQSS